MAPNPPDFDGQCAAFAGRISDVLNATVCEGVEMRVYKPSEVDAVITPEDTQGDPSPEQANVELSCSSDPRTRARAPLALRVFYAARMDREGVHMAIQSSAFGLVVNRSSGRCAIRIEYERHREPHHQAAHVQVDADSAALGWALAQSGQRLKPFQKLHLPAGGRRFRPTVEDLIEFVIDEGFATEKKSDWRQKLQESRAEYERRQASATVRRFPQEAVDFLRSEGYLVIGPRPDLRHLDEALAALRSSAQSLSQVRLALDALERRLSALEPLD